MSDASNYAENEIADWLGGNGATPAMANVYVKLHIGVPGEDGLNNAAGETTRQEATFNAAAGGVVALTATVTWLNVSTAETYSHISLWDAATLGNCIATGALSSSVLVAAGDDFEITALTITVT